MKNPLLLRPYQKRIIDAASISLLNSIKTGGRHIGIYAPCGSGKSVLAAFMAQNSALKGNRTLILTHRVEILKQNFAKMELLGLDVTLLQANTVKLPTGKIVCAMSQTLRSRCENEKYAEVYQEFLGSFDFIIVDEAHRAEVDGLFKYFRKNAWIVGLTATWLRSGSQKQLGDFYSDIVAPVMPSELIELGNILPSKNFFFDAPKLDSVSVDYASGDYNSKQLQAKFAKPERYAGVIDNYMRICPGKKIIIFTTGSEHCISLTKEFCESGIKAKYLLSGKFPETDKRYSGERSQVLKELAIGDVNVLISVEMLSTGVDLPELEGVILDFSTKSYTKYSQCCARPDRPFANQTFFYVLDFGDNIKNFGKFENDPIISLWHKIGGGGVAPSKVCSTEKPDHTGLIGCGRLLPVSLMKCPWCGYEFLTDSQIYEVELTEMVDGVDLEHETIEQFAARMKLKGWDNKWILQNICKKNKDNPKKAFMAAIKILRGVNGEMINENYWWMFKKLYLKDKNKAS